MTAQLWQQVRLLDPALNRDEVVDVLLGERGILEAIAPNLPVPDGTADVVVKNFGGKAIVAPGLVDLYSHSGEPGFEERETLASLCAAARAGGFTRVGVLPDMAPVLDNCAVLSRMEQLLGGIAEPVRLSFWGALTQGTKGEQMSELGELAAAGVLGFCDGKALASWSLVRRSLEYLKPLNLPIALWACDRQLVGKGTAREGTLALQLGLPGNPAMAETAPLAALLELVGAIGTPVHVMHLSTARGVELVRQGKQAGLPITASTTWMHLLGSVASLAGYDPNWRLDPPVGNPVDREALQAALGDGTLDGIAVHHSPYTYEEKTVAFGEAPPGAIGLELALPLLWEGLVASGLLSPLALVRALTIGPAGCLRQAVPGLQVGQAAELLLFDPEGVWTVGEGTLRSRAFNTPWLGKAIRGRVVQTVVMGESVIG